jgi:antitoxin component YwqK of YwqJK toxin-antitoxin module
MVKYWKKRYGKTIRYQGNGKIFYEADIEESETKIKAYFPDGNINFEGIIS